MFSSNAAISALLIQIGACPPRRQSLVPARRAQNGAANVQKLANAQVAN